MNIRKAFGIEQKKITVNGTEYTMQNMPFKQYYEMQERCQDKHGNLLATKFYPEIFDHVIIDPKVSWDDFDSIEELEDVIRAATSFLMRREKQGESETERQE
ncbi:MAG: hypothetical protein Q4A78_03165 [Peptostreptococcaceae bacterium]|nr:hypothetical protein [Peptostreptococcaceae bacterium]